MKESNLFKEYYRTFNEMSVSAMTALKTLILNIERYRNYLFLLLLIAVYLFLDFQTILFSHPQGIHFIRQTDSLSFVANYFKNGFNFFQPQVFNLQSTDGKGASEFPILYYLTAIFYRIFNEHEFILRLITILIASTGFFYLFKLLYSFLNDLVYAIGFSFLFISSTVILYYTNNFLPDAGAFGLTLIGWYFFFSFIKNRNNTKLLLSCVIFFTLASLIKVTYFINPIAAILSIIAYSYSKETGIKNAFQNNVKPLVFFIVSLIVVLSWNSYVTYYNNINNDSYFLIHPRPIWIISKKEIAEVWEYMTNYWYTSYYYPATFTVFLIIFGESILFLKKSERMILIPSCILAIESICYLLLFFAQFKSHDYYFIALIPCIILLVINSFIALKHKFPELINNYVAKLLLVYLCVLSLNFARKNLIQRYEKREDLYASIGDKLSTTRHYLDLIGVSKNAKIIIISDNSLNGGLYFINRPGWSVSDVSEAEVRLVNNHINEGADYIVFTDKKYIYKGFIGIKIGEENGILIYKLKNNI